MATPRVGAPAESTPGTAALTTKTTTTTTATTTKKKKGSKRSGKNRPYLERVNAGPRDNLHGREYWKQLLIQPIIVPDLRHTGIKTQFDDPSETDLLRPDGKSTRKLKSLIKTQVEFVDRLEAEENGLSPLSPASPYAEDGFVNDLVPVPRVEDMALALSPTPRSTRQHGAPSAANVSGVAREKAPKAVKPAKRKVKSKKKTKQREAKQGARASASALSSNNFKMFESMLDSVYGASM